MRPDALPPRVVYPFGGGDLLAALAVFPDATEITTISLEPGGDPRAAARLADEALEAALREVRPNLGYLLSQSLSTTPRLRRGARATIPGPLFLSLVALAIHGYEPISLHYFRIWPDGTLAYLEEPPDEGAAGTTDDFASLELRFRARGSPAEPIRTYRHVAANLDDEHLAASPGLRRHLEAKGSVAALTKAASLLLWYDRFSTVRGYLLGHAAWMVSDYSGIAPGHAAAAGFEQIPYGGFEGLPPTRHDRFATSPGYRERVEAVAQLRELWAAAPRRELPVRFGYLDVNRRKNLLITRRPR